MEQEDILEITTLPGAWYQEPGTRLHWLGCVWLQTIETQISSALNLTGICCIIYQEDRK